MMMAVAGTPDGGRCLPSFLSEGGGAAAGGRGNTALFLLGFFPPSFWPCNKNGCCTCVVEVLFGSIAILL
jgi:hypothetical protein